MNIAEFLKKSVELFKEFSAERLKQLVVPLLHQNGQQDAPPNGGPAERFGNSGAHGGPPSVS